MADLIEPKELRLVTQAGDERVFLLSKFPAIAGREIVSKYPVSNIPKVGEYQQSQEVMLKLMGFVARAMPDGSSVRLTTAALVDNHVGDWETLARLEWAQLEYNTSFFGAAGISAFSESLRPRAEAWISKTLIPLLGSLSQAGKPPSTS